MPPHAENKTQKPKKSFYKCDFELLLGHEVISFGIGTTNSCFHFQEQKNKHHFAAIFQKKLSPNNPKN